MNVRYVFIIKIIIKNVTVLDCLKSRYGARYDMKYLYM